MESLTTPFHIDDPPVHIELTQEQLGALAFIMNSEAYRVFYQPFLVGMLRGFYQDLGDPTKERKDQKPDDYLRGGIAVVHALLSFPNEALDEDRATREKEGRERSEIEHYQERADSGSVGPMGFKYDLEPVEPSEDF